MNIIIASCFILYTKEIILYQIRLRFDRHDESALCIQISHVQLIIFESSRMAKLNDADSHAYVFYDIHLYDLTLDSETHIIFRN